MNDLNQKFARQNLKTRNNNKNLLNNLSYTGSKVGGFFVFIFTFVSGLSMLVNIWDSNAKKYNLIYNVRPSDNDLLLEILEIKKTEDYYNRLFLMKNALNNELNFSEEDITAEIRKLPSLLDENGEFSQQKLNNYYKKGISDKSLREGMKLVMLSNVMTNIISKFDGMAHNISNKIPKSIEISLYYGNIPEITEVTKPYKDYVIDNLINNPSSVLYTTEKRLGYVIEVDISQKEYLKNLMEEYKNQDASEDLYNYLTKNLKKHFKLHKINNLTSIETGFMSDLLFTSDREMVEINNKLYIPITKNARSPHIKSTISSEDMNIINCRAKSLMKNDKLILHLNELLNKYNAGEIDQEYLNENLKHYTVNITMKNAYSILNSKMLIGAKEGEVFLVDSHELGNDIPCILSVKNIEYEPYDANNPNDPMNEFIKRMIRTSYLIQLCAIKFRNS